MMCLQEQVLTLWESECLKKAKSIGQKIYTKCIRKARQSAKGKDIRIQGGVNTIQQFLNAGLVDEFFIHIAPLFIGSGIRLFDSIDKDKYDIQILEVIPSNLTTHLKYKLTKKNNAV